MRLVVGHANPDFDAYAATVAGTKLFDGAWGVYLGSQNANVRAFHNLHEEFLRFTDLRGLDFDAVDGVVMVDTRDPDRIGEIGPLVRRPGVEVVVYDHHPPQEGDLTGATDRSRAVGATTSILVHEIRERGIELTPLEASVMLLGIHEDTGSLTFAGSTAYDAEAVTWLMASGADMEVVNRYLARALDDAQRDLLGQLETSLEIWEVNGQRIAVGLASTENYVDSAGVLTHYVVEDMGHQVAIALIEMGDRLQVVARSRLSEVDVGAVMAHLGGGGHALAASARFRDLPVSEALERIRRALEAEVRPPLMAGDIMSSPVRTIGPETTMSEAGELMARWGHGGLPVMEDGRLAGLVTRKDVDKALRHDLEHAPVKGFMGRDISTAEPETTLSVLEQMLAGRGFGRIPILDGGELIGIVTRKDVLRAEHGAAYFNRRGSRRHSKAREAFVGGVERLLPGQVRETLTTLGEVGADLGVSAHVVGGFVRDMIIGRKNLDVDVVVEGDGIAFAAEAAGRMGARVTVHRRFGTAVIVVSKHFHVDVASSRAEYYTRPGALPTVERSSLRQDLLRRDFTINAMAACLDPECFGAIADPFGGLTDIEHGRVRIMHSLSFIDDPTRVLRAARFEARYGFEMDAHTRQLAAEAIALGVLDEVSGARIRGELHDILDEAAPHTALARLDALGALRHLVPECVAAAAVPGAVEAADEALRTLDGRFATRPDRRRTLLAALAGGSDPGCAERWIRHLRIGRSDAEAVRTLATRGPAVSRALSDRRAMRDSRLYRLLEPLTPETLAVLWSRGDERARERIGHHLDELAGTKLAVSGTDLIEMGYAPSERFAPVLAQTLDDRLDGRASGRSAEMAALRRHARRLLGPAPNAKGTRT